MTRALLFGGLVLVIATVNVSVIRKEALIANGQVVLVELAPVDPRSLMQGDYMALRFMIEGMARGDPGKQAEDGHVVVKLGERGVGKFVRRDAGEPLAADEARLRYRVREGKVKFATNAFFFQEGSAKLYERARYGEFRVASSGDLLLTHMIGANFERLGPPPR